MREFCGTQLCIVVQEIAPLSDLYVIYTRDSSLETRNHDDFEDFFRDALTDPIVDLFIIKLRYRFGG